MAVLDEQQIRVDLIALGDNDWVFLLNFNPTVMHIYQLFERAGKPFTCQNFLLYKFVFLKLIHVSLLPIHYMDKSTWTLGHHSHKWYFPNLHIALISTPLNTIRMHWNAHRPPQPTSVSDLTNAIMLLYEQVSITIALKYANNYKL